MINNKVMLAWSGGKDSALALYELRRQEHLEVAGLLTTLTEGYDRISMHGVRKSLLGEQARALGCALEETFIPPECTNEIYAQRMRQSLESLKSRGVTAVAFGDLFLADVRAYRERMMELVGMECLFPLWGRPTRDVARRFIDLGFRAVVVCVDTQRLSGEFAGREYDEAFLHDLPDDVDPCAENGEFHTFVYDGPIFAHPVTFKRGETLLRENRFRYCDLL